MPIIVGVKFFIYRPPFHTMSKTLFVLCFSTFALTAAHAEDAAFVPGRPGNTEIPIAVATGHWQVESELASYAHDRGQGVSTDTWKAAATSLRYGLAPATDAEVILRPYARSHSGGSTDQGFGDVTLRARRSLLDADGGLSFALIGYLTVPSSHGALGARATEGGLIATGAMALSDAWSAILTVGAAAVSADGGGHAADIYGGANLGYALNSRLGAYAEVFADKTDGSPSVLVMQTGFTFLLDATTQLDAGVEPGISRAADDVRVFIGWAHRY